MYDKIPKNVDVNKIINNPNDPFVTITPKDGRVAEYIKIISETKDYSKIYVTELENGLYQIANGHHRIATLLELGYEKVKVYFVK